MHKLKLIVCVKEVPDTEAPLSAIEVDREKMTITIRGLPPVINPFDEVALEAALQLKETYGGKITIISLGEKLSEPILRKTLAAGADELILVQDKEFKDIDSYSTAWILHKAIKKIGEYDLILTGREAGDWSAGQVGLILSEFLKIPAISRAKKIVVSNKEVRVTKEILGGYEVVKAPLPTLITVSSEFGELRTVSLKDFLSARKKTVKVWNAKEVNIDLSEIKRRKIVDLIKYRPERKVLIIDGKTPEERGENLAIKLREDGVI